MNVERMLKLANTIEREGLSGVTFDMAQWYKPTYDREFEVYCGTAACIAGHALLLWGSEEELAEARMTPGSTSRFARRILGLDFGQGQRLFVNEQMYIHKFTREELESWTVTMSAITRAEAVAAIRRMVREEGPPVQAPATRVEELAVV